MYSDNLFQLLYVIINKFDSGYSIAKIKWLNKIYLANLNYLQYREPFFTNKLIEYWNYSVNNITQPTFSFFWAYLTSPLKKLADKPISRTIRILIASLNINNYFISIGYRNIDNK